MSSPSLVAGKSLVPVTAAGDGAFAAPVRSAHRLLVRLAHRVVDQLGPELVRAGHLVGREAVPAPGLEPGRVRRVAGRHDQGEQALPQVGVRHADHRDLGHGRMGDEYLLALGRVQVHPAGDHHVGDPVGDVDVAVLVHVADVAQGEHPGGDVGLLGLLRVGVIARPAALRGPETEHADLARGQLLAVLVQHHDLVRRAGAPHRPAVGQPLGGVDPAQRPALAAAVGLGQDRPEPVDHGQLGVGRAGRAGLADQPQAGHVVPVAHRGGQREQPLEVGRDHDRGGDAGTARSGAGSPRRRTGPR